MLAHDPTDAADVAEVLGWGASVAEFPTTVEAAVAARAAGMPTGMGAPNVLRGRSPRRSSPPRLVELHVPAKRYLVATDPAYAERLSPVSTVTLDRQGGPMTDAELAAFAADPDLRAAVALRRADEAAKVPGRPVPGLDRWAPVLRQVARPDQSAEGRLSAGSS